MKKKLSKFTQSYQDFCETLSCSPCVLLGLDVGKKHIGIAVSSQNWLIASPLCAYVRHTHEKDVYYFLDLIHRHDVKGIVCGLPLSMDGSFSRQTQAIFDWSRQLYLGLAEKGNDLPVLMWDERLSSQAIDRTVAQIKTGRKKNVKLEREVHDRLTATYILQPVLEIMSQYKLRIKQ